MIRQKPTAIGPELNIPSETIQAAAERISLVNLDPCPLKSLSEIEEVEEIAHTPEEFLMEKIGGVQVITADTFWT